MQNVIKIKSASYVRYEELLLQKEKLLKESEQYQLEYNKLFLALSKEVNEARLECVKKRKTISYCKSIVMQGETINKKELDAFVEKTMKDYQDTLDFLSGNEDNAELKKSLTEPEQMQRIKDTYRKLAKLIHPDMNAKLKDDVVIQDLWNRTCIAYSCLNLTELEELYVLINRYLEVINHPHLDIEIPNINEKIFNLNREIYTIMHTDPYQYKNFIDNKDNVDRKKEELKKELKDYTDYSLELDKEIEKFDILISENKDK